MATSTMFFTCNKSPGDPNGNQIPPHGSPIASYYYYLSWWKTSSKYGHDTMLAATRIVTIYWSTALLTSKLHTDNSIIKPFNIISNAEITFSKIYFKQMYLIPLSLLSTDKVYKMGLPLQHVLSIDCKNVLL